MAAIKASHWFCANQNCGFAAVLTLPEGAQSVPICLCGTAIRQSEPRPASTYLDFLRSEGVLRQQAGSEKES
jgi:hypothetical protein